jgi:hypothetical protein
MKYLRKFNESIFDGDWSDYKQISNSEFNSIFYGDEYFHKEPIKVDEIKNLIKLKVNREVNRTNLKIPSSENDVDWVSFSWDVYRGKTIDNTSMSIHYMTDDWFLVQITTNRLSRNIKTNTYVCEDYEGLKKLINDIL